MDRITNLYKKFSASEGSQHIASEYALRKLQVIVKKFKIKDILEVGLGIGSIAGTTLVLNKNINYTGTEANEFCLQVLPQNLGESFKRLSLFNELSNIPRDRYYDLVIVDGKDAKLDLLKDLLKENGIIVIEGDRQPQQQELTKLFPVHKFVHLISLKKNRGFSPFPSDHWQGGLKVLLVNPDRHQKMWWAKEIFFSKLKKKYRSFFY